MIGKSKVITGMSQPTDAGGDSFRLDIQLVKNSNVLQLDDLGTEGLFLESMKFIKLPPREANVG
jgi:hypothetical protein